MRRIEVRKVAPYTSAADADSNLDIFGAYIARDETLQAAVGTLNIEKWRGHIRGRAKS